MLFTEMYTHYTTGEIKTKLLIENFYVWMNTYLLVCENSTVSFHFLIQLLSVLDVLLIRSTGDVIIRLLAREI